jgi:hypothetical protein
MGRTLTLQKGSSADGVTVASNVASRFSSIFVVRTPKSRYYTFLNNQAFILKLVTAAAAEISAVSRMIPAFLMPTARVPKEYGAPFTYAAWRNTPLSSSAGEPTQYNSETTVRRLLRFESGQNLTLPQDWEFHLMLESPDIVDWTQANTFIEIHVDESSVATQVAGV